MGIRWLLVSGLVLGMASTAGALDRRLPCSTNDTAAATPTARSIRPSRHHARLTELLTVGMSRSDTFRDLVATLDASDVIVHVSFRAGLTLRSYLAHDLVAASTHRYLRVILAIDLPDRDLVPLLAHELQHAVEVSEARDVVDATGMLALFVRIGYAGKGEQVRETEAARRAQQRVKTELARADRCHE
jgi:hypothetical protein